MVCPSARWLEAFSGRQSPARLQVELTYDTNYIFFIGTRVILQEQPEVIFTA